MFIEDVLEKKRDGRELSREDIQFFVKGYTAGRIKDYQASALLMAIYINGLNTEETAYLTEAMLYSGKVMDLGHIPGVKVDKHSTGGVGDKTSLIIAPVCAALGVPVPMISGRGLGYTGGTLDKLESIPGFNVNLELDEYEKQVQKIGTCLIGQTRDIAPADKKIYALRDVTATVANLSLITASIMSKKLAEGIDSLVLDVKCGKGAFMTDLKSAQALADSLVMTGKRMGKEIVALITNMDQPLGAAIGNALEVKECIDIMKGHWTEVQEDLVELTVKLASHMILLGKKAMNIKDAEKKVYGALKDGSALEKFKEIVLAQGGDTGVINDPSIFATALHKWEFKASQGGYINDIDSLKIAKGALMLGAGRQTIDSEIEYGAGVVLHKKTGMAVEEGEVILEAYYNDQSQMNDAQKYFISAVEFVMAEPPKRDLIHKIIE